jgi:hypothetical protein
MPGLVTSKRFEAGLESAYAVIVPSANEVMAKRILHDLGPAPGAGRLPPGPRRKPRSGRRMPITRDDVKTIRGIIEGWSQPKLTWELLGAVVQKSFGTGWHRQSLFAHPQIAAAFQAKKLELRKAAKTGRRPKRRTSDGTILYLEQQIRDATEEISELKKLLAEREAQLARWRHNAFLHGVSVAQLDEPLLPNDRGRSDGH